MQFMDQIFSFKIGDINFFFFSSNIRVSKNTNIFKIQPTNFISISNTFTSDSIKSNQFFHYSGYQISNAQLGGTFQMGG